MSYLLCQLMLLAFSTHLVSAQLSECGSGWCSDANGDCSNALCYCDSNYYGMNCTQTCTPCLGGEVCTGADSCAGCHPDCDDCGTVNTEPRCKCPDGYTGDTCTESFCDSKPCLNGGLCSSVDGGFHCNCVGDWVGPTCALNCTPACSTIQLCAPISPPDPPTEAVCECRAGLSGDNCTIFTCGEYNEPCLNGGECFNSTCICKNSFTGIICEKGCNPTCQASEKCVEEDDEEDPVCKGTCDSAVVCVNGGTCTEDSVCQCPVGWHGDFCQLKVICEDHAGCENGGTCTENVCLCAEGWEGEVCQDSGSTRLMTSLFAMVTALLLHMM